MFITRRLVSVPKLGPQSGACRCGSSCAQGIRNPENNLCMFKTTARNQMTNSQPAIHNVPTAAPTCYVPPNFLTVIKLIHYKQLPHTSTSRLFRNTWAAAAAGGGITLFSIRGCSFSTASTFITVNDAVTCLNMRTD